MGKSKNANFPPKKKKKQEFPKLPPLHSLKIPSLKLISLPINSNKNK